MTIRWIAQVPATIDEIVRLAGGDPEAVRDGRVFVGRARASEGLSVEAGTEIVIHGASAAPREGEVLLHRRGVLAMAKPAGIPTIPDQGGKAHSLVAVAAKAAGVDPKMVHPTSRLDRDVSGVVLFALDAEAREALQRARDEGRYGRRYVALAAAAPAPAEGLWDAPIGRAKNPRLRAIARKPGSDAKPATTGYVTLGVASGRALLAVEPITGRTHQIRVHAAHAGAPLLGDGDYGGPTRLTLEGGRSLSLRRIYLHCARVWIEPLGLELAAELPAEIVELWTKLGGSWDQPLARIFAVNDGRR